MTRRNAMFQFLTFAFVMASGASARADAGYFEVHKLDLWPTRYFTIVDSSGAKTVGMSTSAALAGYTFYDASYTPFLEATLQAVPVSGSWLPNPLYQFMWGFDTLRVADKTGETVGYLRRHRGTFHKAKFTLRNPEGHAYAQATVNASADAVLVVDAGQPMRELARLRRVAGEAGKDAAAKDYWAVSVCDTDFFPHDMLRTLATYVSDYQDWFLWSSFSYAPNVVNSARNAAVERTTDTFLRRTVLPAP